MSKLDYKRAAECAYLIAKETDPHRLTLTRFITDYVSVACIRDQFQINFQEAVRVRRMIRSLIRPFPD